MVSATNLNTTITVVDAAAKALVRDGVVGVAKGTGRLVKDATVGNLENVVRNRGEFAARMDRAGSAITSFSSQTSILSRVFIDESLLGEPVLPNMMKSLHEFYAAQIISALHLSQMVDSARTVQDVLGVVQTGHNQRQHGIIGNIAARRMGQESFLEHYTGESFSSSNIGVEALGYTHGPQDANDRKVWRENQSDAKEDETERRRNLNRETAVRSVKVSDNRIGPMGELYEIKLSNPNGNGVAITVPVFIQMQPSIVAADIAPRFVDMNVPQSTWQRWTMMRAGELTFWRDFIMHRDMIKRNKILLKDPAKAAALADFQRTISMKDKYALDDVTDSLSSRQSSNLANSVMILSEDAVHQAQLDSGIDLHNPADRQRYFRNTYTMILVVVDPLHQRVTMYFNGLNGDINSSYTDYRPKDSHFDPKEFMTAMQAFSTNNIRQMR